MTTYKYGFERTDATRRHGDLIEVSYNDGTPGLTNTYDRRGRLASVARTNRTASWTSGRPKAGIDKWGECDR